MKQLLLLLLIIISNSIDILADKRIDVIGEVYDSTMGEPLVGATVRLLNANDSSFVAVVHAESILSSNGEIYKFPKFSLTLPDRNKKYMIAVSFTGYCPKYVDLNPTTLGKREYEIDLGKIYLSPVSKNLREVSVTATKIKFYNRGDTVVYNADAFNLAEGSMLDALIRQLPEVRLTQRGEIFVSGEKVESLLLNGKDFFSDNRQIMLNNLGAYMVKNVEVYEKAGFESEVTGTDSGDRQLVMDVRLKKEFMIGFLGNMDAGYGTHDRYLARIFGGAFTPQSKLAIYANANNVNASQTPQPDTDWRPETMPTGTKDVLQCGVKYGWGSKDRKWSVYTGADFSHEKATDGTDISRTNFLSSGNTYESTHTQSRGKVLEVKSYNTLEFKNLKGYGLQFVPEGSYSHWDRDISDAAASFTRNIDGMTGTIVEDIYDGNHESVLRYLINRKIEMSKLHGHSWNGAGNLRQVIKMPGSSDQMEIRVYGSYSNRKDDRFERFDINYGDNPVPTQSANRYYKNHPDFSSRILASAKYTHFFSREIKFSLGYEYEHNYSKSTSELFRLDMLDNPEEDFFGTLPSETEYRMTLDNANSYLSRNSEDISRIIPRIERVDDKFGWWCELPVNLSHRRLHYLRGDVDSRITRNYAFINYGYFGASYANDKDRIYWQGHIRSKLPDLVAMVDMTDATDPLNVTKGNPGLKKSVEFETSINYRRALRQNTSLSVRLEYRELFNALARGYIYDTGTGVKTSSVYNVDGNRTFLLSAEYNTPLGKTFYLGNTLDGAHAQSVDLVGADTPELSHNRVRTMDLHDRLYLSANFGRQTLYVRFDGSYRRYTSNLSDFGTQDTWTFQTGAGATLNLPCNFQLTTDFSVYNRRGFTDSALNSDNYVWNARLTYRALKGSLLFMVDGYDMLRNLSNISYTINAQARTEMVRTVLPSYFMFHVQWRFNKKPGRKNG